MHCLGTLCKQLKLGHNKSFKLHSTYIQFNYKMQLSRWVNNRTFLDGKLAKMHTWSNFFMHSSYFSMYYVLGRKIVIINLVLACLHTTKPRPRWWKMGSKGAFWLVFFKKMCFSFILMLYIMYCSSEIAIMEKWCTRIHKHIILPR